MGNVARILLLLLLVSSAAHAAPIPLIKVARPQGLYTSTTPDRTLFRHVRRALKPVRIRLQRVKNDAIATENITMEQYYTEAYQWQDIAKNRGWTLNSRSHVVLPPIVHNGDIYVGGVGYVCNDFSVSYQTDYDENGQGRRSHSVCAMAHEIGHSLGARHTDREPNLMRSTALSDVGSDIGSCWLGLLPESVKQIKACARKAL